MQEIYNLKKQGKTFKEIQALLKNKTSIATLSKRLKKFCLENNLKFLKEKSGRKSINLILK